jgi:hypothetical protein
MRKRKVLMLLCLVLVATLFLGCDPEEEIEEETESRGKIIMTTGDPKDSTEKEDWLIEDNSNPIEADDPIDDSDVETMEGMFGNAPYTENAVIEYYFSQPSGGDEVQFTRIYGLHVASGQILAMEDIIIADLVEPETMTAEEKENIIQDIYNEMEDANFERANGQEIIEAFNGSSDESAISYIYLVFEADRASLESYDQYLDYFDQYGFTRLDSQGF